MYCGGCADCIGSSTCATAGAKGQEDAVWPAILEKEEEVKI